MAEVLHGKATGDNLAASANKTQVYGLAGDDTLTADSKSNVLLIGGSGNDRLIMTGGDGTLSGGAGKDTFEFTYSADKKISAVIEDIDPSNDKIVVNFAGTGTPKLSSVTSGDDVIWTDSNNYFNLTLKGSSDASDYFDGTASDEIWEVFRLTNNEREKQNLPWYTLSQGLTDGASIRATEIVDKFSHTRPNGTSCFTAVAKEYRWDSGNNGYYIDGGENIAEGYSSASEAVTGWMNSPGHRANILDSTYGYTMLGVGYNYDSSAVYNHYWVQMFSGGLKYPDTLSTAELLSAKIEVATISATATDTTPADTTSAETIISSGNKTIQNGGTYTIAKNFTGTITLDTTEVVTIDGLSAGNLKNVNVVTKSANSNLTIKDLTVTNESGSVVTFGTGTNNKLTLAGKNDLKTSDTWAAVINIGGGLTIDGTGSLDVTAGSQGAGIGFNSYADSSANITINGGTITTSCLDLGHGAGIGSGCNGSIGNISIGGSAKITSTSYDGAGIGSGDGGSCGNISIGGSAKVTSTSHDGAGIGSGEDGSCGKITVSDKSSVLITHMQKESLSTITINGKTYTNTQLLFENGAQKTLSERIIVNEIVENGTDKGDILGSGNSNWYTSTTINAGKGDDTIHCNGANFVIYAGGGNDYINGVGYSNGVVGYITLDAGTGNDTIWIGSTLSEVGDYYSSISGGDGNDTMRVDGNYTTILGGSGNDSISFHYSEHVTVNGGKGDDLIQGVSRSVKGRDSEGNYIYQAPENVLYLYTAGDGNDTINYFNEKNTIQISGGSYSTQTSGNDIIVKVGDGSITLKDFKDSKLNIKGTQGGSSSTSTTTGGGSTSTTKGGSSSTSTTTGGSSSTSTTTGGGSSSTTRGGGSSTSTTTGGGSSSTTRGGSSSTSTTRGGSSSTSTTRGGSIPDIWASIVGGGSSSTSTTRSSSTSTTGTSSTSTTRGSSTSTTGTSSTSTTRGSSTSTTGTSSTSTTRYGGSTSTGTSSTSTTRYGGSSTSTTTGGGSSSTTKGGGSSTSTTTGGGSSSTTNQFVYTGGDKTVSNYAGEKIVFGELYTGSTFDSSGNFFVGSSTGTLTIQDAMDKLVNIVDANGDDFIKAYKASAPGLIDGRGLVGYEVIEGSSTGTDVIFAGDGGSQLWGGSGFDADALVGGNGSDSFIVGRFQGADNIFNASSADVVNLTDASLSDIVGTAEVNGSVLIAFNTGNAVNIQSTELLSAAVKLADGSSWRYNHATKTWQGA